MNTPLFTPQALPAAEGPHLQDGAVYVYWDPQVILAVNVALATERPLLIRGAPGSGKSSLARNLSLQLGREFLSYVVSAHVTARDLLWDIDAVERLARAQAALTNQNLADFVQPGPFWRAFTRRSPHEICAETVQAPSDDKGAVLLIDEIDKADPDLPNALLEPMANRRFAVPSLRRDVLCERPAPLVIFTTNGYRQLPRPFVRRCIELTIKAPTTNELIDIATSHFGKASAALYRQLATKMVREPEIGSVAEYLDAIQACLKLGIDEQSDDFTWVFNVALRKPGRTE